ncbi:MAG: hypothetical protein WKH64_14870 [Chloroflexia bacterium]
MRPANHPLRRMLGVAHVIAAANAQGGLAACFLCLARAGDERRLLELLQPQAPDGDALIGRDRATEAAVNAVLPCAAAHGRSRGEAALVEQARALWLRLPRTSPSQVETLMRQHLAVPRGDRSLSSVRCQQGLLHLYRRYCKQRLCEWCPLSRLASGE